MDDTPLFDAGAFDGALAATRQPLPLFKTALEAAADTLKRRFMEGAPAPDLVTGRARVVDQLLVRAWGLTMGEAGPEVALVAVGGYGRGELHPHSDIDLLIMVGGQEPEALREPVERLLLLLWDMGLDIGHSVRTIGECVEEAERDITVATNLMESRLLAGSERLHQEMRQRTGPEWVWPSRRFFEAKWQEQIARHRRFHDTAYNLEPNIKEGPGGLRDIQMIGWVAKRHFGADTLSDLVEHGFLTAQEYRTLAEGQNFLWKIRFGLHTLAGRREDRLLFDHQRTLARQFGYADEGPHLAVESFMKDYYRTVMELGRLNEMLLQLFQEEILYADAPSQPVPINRRFQTRKGFIEVAHDRVFERYPFAMLEIFLVLAQHPEAKGVRAETIRLLRKHSRLVDDKFRKDLRCRSLFMEILRQPEGVTHELKRMNRYGVLAAYLPVFARVVGQMQHDLFHVYTVDEHTLFVVRNLRRFTVPAHLREFPLCSEIIQRIPKPEVLYITALFHDIAKGRGGDHSELGAEEVKAFCAHHLLSRYDTHLAAWLVRHHLIMSTTAQRRDISDPEVINEFAARVGDTTRLDHLYLLTVADIRATSPNLWNSWKEALLVELYHATRHALRRGLAEPLDREERIQHTQEEARALLEPHRIDAAAVDALWNRLGDDYFLRYAADEIAWHTQAVLDTRVVHEPLVLIRQESRRGGTEIFVFAPIHGQLFALTTNALDQMGLNIMDARIISSADNHSVNTFTVLEESGRPIDNAYRIQEIQETLLGILREPDAAPAPVQRHVARQLKHFPIPTRVSFQDDQPNRRTIMEVQTSDRPGLLSRIGQALGRCRVQLQNAKIATLGERVEDIFFITDGDERPLPEKQMDCLRETITKMLEEG